MWPSPTRKGPESAEEKERKEDKKINKKRESRREEERVFVVKDFGARHPLAN